MTFPDYCHRLLWGEGAGLITCGIVEMEIVFMSFPEKSICPICRNNSQVIFRKIQGQGLPLLDLHDCSKCGGWYWIDHTREAILEHKINRKVVIHELISKLIPIKRDYHREEYPLVARGIDVNDVGLYLKGKLITNLPIPTDVK